MRVALLVLLTVLSLLASTALAGAATTLHASLSGKKEVPTAGNGKGTARSRSTPRRAASASASSSSTSAP